MSDQKKAISPGLVLQLVLFIGVLPFLPLLVSWQWGWWQAWVYALTYILGFVVSRVLAARRHPDLLAERARSLQQENVEAWDKVLAPLVGLGSGFILLIAGLDARFGWSSGFGLVVELSALAVILAGYALGTYALMENRFFSGMVRIQRERGHKVVSSGPYGWVRHPGYLGTLLVYLATPFFLDSTWAFIPAGLLTVALIVRTALEDKTLRDQLDGYREYSQQVRYRLLPGIW